MRISLHGPSGAGKSTLSHILSRELGIPMFELDREITSPNKFDGVNLDKLSRILSGNHWIVEGSEPRAFKDCVAKADIIFYLDFNRLNCLQRVFSRNVLGNRMYNPNNIGRKALTLNSLNYILRGFPSVQLEQVEYLQNLKVAQPTKTIHISRNSDELVQALSGLIRPKVEEEGHNMPVSGLHMN